MGIDDLWREIIIRPLLNLLVVLYTICFNNMGVAIILFTVIVRLVTLPLTIKQLKQMRSMMDLQPRNEEIQERYSRDRQRVSQETHAALPGGGRQPRWLPGASGHPDAHSLRAVPGVDTDGVLAAG